MSYLGMGEVGALIDVYQGHAYRLDGMRGLGRLGSGWFGGVMAAISQNAQALTQGKLILVDPTKLPGAQGLHLAFDPNVPGTLYQVAPADGGWQIPQGYNLSNDQVIWSGSGPAPWPGPGTPPLPASFFPAPAAASASAPPPPVPVTLPMPTQAPSRAVTGQLASLARQGDTIASSMASLQGSVSSAISNAANVQGSDTSSAQSSSDTLDGLIGQAQDLASQLDSETDLPSAQSELRQLQSLARQAKSAAAQAVRAANSAAATANAALHRQQLQDAADQAAQRRADALAAAQAAPPVPAPLPQYYPPPQAPQYAPPPQYGYGPPPGVWPDGIPLMYVQERPQYAPRPSAVQYAPAYDYGAPPSAPPEQQDQGFQLQTESSDEYFPVPSDAFDPGSGELFGMSGLGDYPGEPLWRKGFGNKKGPNLNGVNGSENRSKYYPPDKWPSQRAGVVQPWEGPFWPGNVPPIPAGKYTSGSLNLGAVPGAAPATGSDLLQQVAPSIRQQILDDVAAKKKAQVASDASAEATKTTIKKWVKVGAAVAAGLVALSVGAKLLRRRATPSAYTIAANRPRRNRRRRRSRYAA